MERETANQQYLYQRRPQYLIGAIETVAIEPRQSGRGSHGYMLEGSGNKDEVVAPQLAPMLEKLNAQGGAACLEIGPGFGGALEDAMKHYPNITWKSLDIADYPTPDEVSQSRTLGNAENLAEIFPDTQFDFIHASYVAMHMIDPLGFLEQVHTKLKPGGIAHITGGFLETVGLTGVIDRFRSDEFEFIPRMVYEDGKLIEAAIGELVIRKKNDGPLFTDIEYAPELYFDNHTKMNRVRYQDKRPNSIANKYPALMEQKTDSAVGLLIRTLLINAGDKHKINLSTLPSLLDDAQLSIDKKFNLIKKVKAFAVQYDNVVDQRRKRIRALIANEDIDSPLQSRIPEMLANPVMKLFRSAVGQNG